MHTRRLCVASLAVSLLVTGCLPVALFEYATHDVACEAHNADVERGATPGPQRVCQPPTFSWQQSDVQHGAPAPSTQDAGPAYVPPDLSVYYTTPPPGYGVLVLPESLVGVNSVLAPDLTGPSTDTQKGVPTP